MRQQAFDVAHILHPMRMSSAFAAIQICDLPYVMTLTDFFADCFRVNLVNLQNQPCAGSEGGRRCAADCLVPPWTAGGLLRRAEQASGLLAGASAIVCPSNYTARRYRQMFPGSEFLVIPHGVDILSAIATDAAGQDAGDRARPLTLGFVGSIVPQKGLDVVFRAMQLLPQAPIRLRVVGGLHGDASYCAGVMDLAKADPRIEMNDQVAPDRVFNELNAIDVLCLPSRVAETYSMILHEAAAAGVPALVSDVGAPAERISNSGGGRTLPVDDVDAWARAFAELVADPGLVSTWRSQIPLPFRIEEEAFLYESLYRRSAARP
jgi:glycosyltransferase involved in cell wall biosynthesis